MEEQSILIIEDEVKIARFLELELKHEGYLVDVCHDGKKGLEQFHEGNYHLILLDLMLPSLNGLEIIRRIRKVSQVPIIMLTAKGEVVDKVVGLDSGADDYITKPFAIEEVLARMRVALKRYGVKQEDDNSYILTLKALQIDTRKRTVKMKVSDNADVLEDIELTKTEFDLLVFLVQNKDMVLTRQQILNSVWGYDYFGETNVVDVYVRYLRTKIDDKFNVKYIHTIRGIGYYVKDGG